MPFAEPRRHERSIHTGFLHDPKVRYPNLVPSALDLFQDQPLLLGHQDM